MVRKIFFTAFLAVVVSFVHAVQYTKNDSINVVRLLKEARAKRLTTKQEYVHFFIRQFFGVPYVASTLEVNKKEQLIVNLRQLDCTTYVENVVALTLCAFNGKSSFADFCRYLQLIRYRKGCAVSYQARLHYFTDWINDNSSAGICTNIKAPNPPFTSVQKIFVNFMTTHADKYPMLRGNVRWISEISKVEQSLNGKTYRYIPKTGINNSKLLRQTIHNGDIIVILTNKKGLDTQHLGFAQWRKDGLHLVNASSIHKKVVEEPMLLYTYLQKHKSMTGIRIVRL